MRVRFVSDNVTRIITNTGEINVSGRPPLTSLRELTLGQAVTAYWPGTRSFYAAAIISNNGKWVVTLFLYHVTV